MLVSTRLMMIDAHGFHISTFGPTYASSCHQCLASCKPKSLHRDHVTACVDAIDHPPPCPAVSERVCWVCGLLRQFAGCQFCSWNQWANKAHTNIIRYNWIQLLKPMYRRIISPKNLRDLWLLSPLKWHIQIQANSKDSRASSHHSKDVTSNDRKFSKQKKQKQPTSSSPSTHLNKTSLKHTYPPPLSTLIMGTKTSDILYRIRLARQHLEGPGHWSSR